MPLLGYEVDFLWEPARFVVEADGGDHLEPTQRDRDNERDIVLARAGYLVRRYSLPGDGRSEARVAAEILEILRERARCDNAPSTSRRDRGDGMATEEQTQQDEGASGNGASGADTLSITDNRTGETYEVEITDETIKAMDLRQIKVNEDDFGMMTYDPAFTNTASCRSSITYIDGEAGILQHRGYTIEDLCEKSSYLEVAYLLVFGELPTAAQLDRWATTSPITPSSTRT